MAGNSYPHIIFAKDADTLPKQALAELLTGMFPGAEVEQGEIKAVLRLPDYAYTFWYDDDADGLGDRYADYASPIRRKRITRCTTMIDASGESDPDGRHRDEVARALAALAERPGVYVFSEETKRFLAMEYDDGTPGAVAESTLIAETAEDTGFAEQEFVSAVEASHEPEADLRSSASYPAHVDDAASEVVLEADEKAGDFPHTEQRPVDRPADGQVAGDVGHGPVVGAGTATGGAHVAGADVNRQDADRVVIPPLTSVGPAERQATTVSGGQGTPGTAGHGEPVPADRPVELHEVPLDTDRGTPTPAAPTSAPAAPAAPATPAPAATSAPQPVPAPDSPAAGRPVEPVRGEQDEKPDEKPEEKQGLFKRLFGRKR